MALSDPNAPVQPPQLSQHPYIQQSPFRNSARMSNNYPTLQAATSIPVESSVGANNNMVQVPVLPHQQHMYPTLQAGTVMYTPQSGNQPLPPVQFVGSSNTVMMMNQQEQLNCSASSGCKRSISRRRLR